MATAENITNAKLIEEQMTMFSRLWLGNSISFTMGKMFWWQVNEKTKMGSCGTHVGKNHTREYKSTHKNDE